MVQNKQIRNFLFLLSGIVLLFCGSIPNFAESVIALLRGLLSFINLGWIGTLLIISRVLLILGGTALSVIGAIFMIQDATAAKRQPNWVVLGCTGGGVFFGLLSLVPLLFWIGIFGVAALVVAMVFAYKDVVGAWRNPVSKIASFMMIGSLRPLLQHPDGVDGNTLAGRSLRHCGIHLPLRMERQTRRSP